MIQIRNCLANCLFAGVLTSAALQASAAEAASESVVYSFKGGKDGEQPTTDLIKAGGILYGTTWTGGQPPGCGYGDGCGTVFSIEPATGAEAVLHRFKEYPTSGSYPTRSLISVGGYLYGTTSQGGVADSGTVFKINRRTGDEKILYSFCSQKSCTDGAFPNGGLINVDGTLYGTTSQGGANCVQGGGCGTVFKVDPTTGAETLEYSFKSGKDGLSPRAGLIDVDGMLYGTTCYTGQGYGTVFKIDPATGAEIVVYNFKGSPTDGSCPVAGLLDVKGTLYGTTYFGGADCPSGECGTVFKVNPTTGDETMVYSFCSQASCTDGGKPAAGLINVGGTLYGTTSEGGTSIYGGGTVFTINPETGAETVVYSFCRNQRCTDGNYPAAGLVDFQGTLYGTTQYGGKGRCPYIGYDGCGTVFKITP